MEILHITKDNLNEMLQSHETMILDFWAEWCVPCKMLSPTLDQIAQERPDVVIGKVNVDEEPELASEFRIMSIPTLIFAKDGKPKLKSAGVQPKAEILKIVESL